MTRLAALLAFAGALAAPAAHGSPFSPGCERAEIVTGSRQERTIAVDGSPRAFILDVPESVKPRRPAALLLDFHGFGHSAAGVWRVSGFRELGVREGFITVYPQGLPVRLLGRSGDGWEMASSGNREVSLVRRLIDAIGEEYCIDRRRVFATGFSNGAFLSHLLGCVLADQIAAIAPVSGGMREGGCAPSRAVPAIIHHGRDDAIVPVERGRELYARWKEIGGCTEEAAVHGDEECVRAAGCRDDTSVVYCEFAGEHRWPAAATTRIWEFFQRHPMSRRPAGGGDDVRSGDSRRGDL